MRVKKSDLTRITEENIDHFRKRGCFGIPEVGKYGVYLGPTDGGYAVLSEEDAAKVMERGEIEL